jgi:GntR family transcriptional regulator
VDSALHEIAAVPDPVQRARAYSRLLAQQQGMVAEIAALRREAIAEAQASGKTQDEIARELGVTPGRVSQMKKAIGKAPKVLVQRALPTDPVVRSSKSLFLAEAERQGIKAERRMLYVGPEPASEHVAACLRVEPGEPVLARRKLQLANGIPVRLPTSYFRLDIAEGTALMHPQFVLPSLQAAIQNLGYRFGHAEETLTARPPTEYEASKLDLEPGEWVVQVLRASYDTTDVPIHTLETVCVATRTVFTIGQVAGADEF